MLSLHNLYDIGGFFLGIFSLHFFYSIQISHLMAAVAACKRVGQIGPNSWTIGGVSIFKGVVSPLGASTFPPSAIRLSLSPSPFSQWRQVSQQLVKSNGKRLFLIDTLALVISKFSFSFFYTGKFQC